MADIVKYVRDEEGTPFGVVVAVDKESIGFSICHPKDKWNRGIGKLIARNRALKHFSERKTTVSDKTYKLLTPVLTDVKRRAEKYFK